MSFAIVTDTSANLPTKEMEMNHVTVVPFSYYIDGKEFTCLDTDVFDGKQYYDSMKKGTRVSTSQVTPQRYIDYMKDILEKGEDILYVGMSSGISGSFNSAELAARQLSEEYPERSIKLVDTLGASLGEGIFVLHAIECKKVGMSLEETWEYLMEVRMNMYQVFMVDDLMHLRKSGRVSNVSAVLGTVLNIKPILKGNEEGKIVAFEKCRGRKRSIEALVSKYEELVDDQEEQIVGIAHAGCMEDAQYLAELLNKNKPPKEIMTVCYEPVTGSHVGPGTLALFFLGERNVRNM